MKKTPLAFLLLSALTLTAATAQAQQTNKNYSTAAATDPGISAQLCQNDMLIIRTPGPVKSVGVTLPNNVEPLFDGNRVILRGNITSGRTPVVILMQNNDDMYRLNLTACPTRGVSNLITIMDASPAPAAARELTNAPVTLGTAPNAVNTSGNTAPITATRADGGFVSLPAPTTVKLEMARNVTGLTLSVANGTAQTLALSATNLKVTAGGQTVTIPASVGGNLASGMIGTYAVPLPEEVKQSDVQVEWTVVAPAVKVSFVLTADLR